MMEDFFSPIHILHGLLLGSIVVGIYYLGFFIGKKVARQELQNK